VCDRIPLIPGAPSPTRGNGGQEWDISLSSLMGHSFPKVQYTSIHELKMRSLISTYFLIAIAQRNIAETDNREFPEFDSVEEEQSNRSNQFLELIGKAVRISNLFQL
jgi:hypothetical protein